MVGYCVASYTYPTLYSAVLLEIDDVAVVAGAVEDSYNVSRHFYVQTCIRGGVADTNVGAQIIMTQAKRRERTTDRPRG